MDTPPEGFRYRPAFLDEAEERELLARFDELEFEEIAMKGVVARRTAVRYGYGYDYDRRQAVPGADPIPEWLEPVRARAAELRRRRARAGTGLPRMRRRHRRPPRTRPRLHHLRQPLLAPPPTLRPPLTPAEPRPRISQRRTTA